MIPKIIHYCWLSGEPFPEMIQQCIDSWKRYMPDYKFILWDTRQFDINSHLYVKQAFECKKYAFASDYIRLYALYHYGGIYLDTDILVYKSFDELLDCQGFTGFEVDHAIAAWIFASEKGNPLFKELLSYYDNKKFIFRDGSCDMTPNVVPVTDTLLRHGLKLGGEFQRLDNIVIYPRTFFCPHVPYGEHPDCFSENTYAQHLFNAGWKDEIQKRIFEKKHYIEKKYGKILGLIYYGVKVLQNEGIFSFMQQWKVRMWGRK